MRTRLLAAALAALCLAPPAWADQDTKTQKPEAKTYQVPYRLTNFNHVMVRAKINGKGPFNFIVDTGAPALFVSIPAAEQAGVKPGKNGWGTLDRFEIEGGVVLEKPKARIETPFQLEGMNGMGLAGVELHGMIGYTVLARYRIDFDFMRSKLGWTPVDFDPGTPRGLEGGGGTAGLNAMGGIMKLIGGLLGKKAAPDVRLRPFLGAELAEDGKGVTVKAILDGGPAAAGGLKVGDRITYFSDRTVRERDDVNRYLGHLKPGDTAKVTVERAGATRELAVKVGEGF
jgi:hypothetical protein